MSVLLMVFKTTSPLRNASTSLLLLVRVIGLSTKLFQIGLSIFGVLRGSIFLLCAASFSGVPSFAKDPQVCDCGDVKFEHSRERIKITHSKEVIQSLQATKASNPSEAEVLKKVVATADTYMQRHMNGEIYQDQDPDGWDAYNGPIMAVPLDAWMRMQSERSDKDRSRWTLCPAAKLVAVGYKPNNTLVHYELITVGRFTNAMKGLDPFSDAEVGNVFSLNLTLNDQGRIVNMGQLPNGAWSYTYTTAVSALKQNLRRKGRSDAPAAEVERLAAHERIWTQQLNELQQAAKVCTTNKNQGR